MRRLVSSLALVCLVSAPRLAVAQPSTGTVFISGGGFAAIEQSPTSSGFGAPRSDSGGTVAGGTLGVGIHLTEKISARVEGSLTGELRQRQDAFGYPYLTPEVLAAFSDFGSSSALVVPGMPETRVGEKRHCTP